MRRTTGWTPARSAAVTTSSCPDGKSVEFRIIWNTPPENGVDTSVTEPQTLGWLAVSVPSVYIGVSTAKSS